MRNVIWERMRAMVPTLLGITLLSFVLIQLAPGDPVTLELEGDLRSGSVSRRAVEDLRHAYFLDLPLLMNLSPLDVERYVDRLVTRLGHPTERKGAIADLVRVGGAALPFLVPRIEGTHDHLRFALLEALAGIAEACGLGDELARATRPEDYWEEYWRFYRLDYTPGRARRLVRRLVLREDELARVELERLHTYAFAPLIEALDDDLSPVAAARVIAVLHHIRGSGAVVDARATDEERTLAVASWKEWWRREAFRYQRSSAIGRLTAMFTQTQYFKWLQRVVTLSFGVSLQDGRPILDKLAEKLPTTLLLSLLSVAVAYGCAIPLGVLSALRRQTLLDRLLTLLLFFLYSLPVFWTATLLIQHTCGVSGPAIFPLGGLRSDNAADWPWWRQGLDLAHHLVLPVLCLSYVSVAALSRYQRVAMLEVLTEEYVRTARAKGLHPWRVVVVHALRNALLPVVTLLGLQIPYMISGAVIVERLFNIPGMGLETFQAIRTHDYPWIMAVVTLSAMLTMVGILLSDLLYALLDPRVRLGARPGDDAS